MNKVQNINCHTVDSFANLCINVTGNPRKRTLPKGGLQVSCPCPDHIDKNPSLSINRDPNGTLLLTCQSGCSFAQIMSALNCNSKDLFSSKIPEMGYSQNSGTSPQPRKPHTPPKPPNLSNLSCILKDSNYSYYSVTNSKELKELPACAIPSDITPEGLKSSLFNLIRFLAMDKSLKENSPIVIPEKALTIIQAWHNHFFPDFKYDDTEYEATFAWRTVETSIASGIINEVMNMKTPKKCPAHYLGTPTEKLFSMCWHLAEKQIDGIFFLTAKTASDALHLTGNPNDRTTASRLFIKLVGVGILIKRLEFKKNEYRPATRYQLNPKYSAHPSRKDKITVRSWHRYSAGLVKKATTLSIQKTPFDKIKAEHNLVFDTAEFCKRGSLANWKTDYGKPLSSILNSGDMEAAVLSYAETMPAKAIQKKGQE